VGRIVSASGSGQWSPYAKRLRNYATFRYAQEFHFTARKVGSCIVQAYLLGHAIELYLKSYLLHEGFTVTLLKSKKYGHNLTVLLAEAQSRGLEQMIRISPELVEDLRKLNAVYPESLRYFSLLHLLTRPKMPSLARLFRFAASMDKRLEKHVAVQP